jgi:hypothetical protein
MVFEIIWEPSLIWELAKCRSPYKGPCFLGRERQVENGDYEKTNRFA